MNDDSAESSAVKLTPTQRDDLNRVREKLYWLREQLRKRPDTYPLVQQLDVARSLIAYIGVEIP